MGVYICIYTYNKNETKRNGNIDWNGEGGGRATQNTRRE